MPPERMPLVEGYLKNGDLGIAAAETLIGSNNPALFVVAAGHVGRAVENYLKAYIEFLGGAGGHSHNLGQLVGEIRRNPSHQLGTIGSSPILKELMPFITGSSYAFTENLPNLTKADAERYLRFANELRAVIDRGMKRA